MTANSDNHDFDDELLSAYVDGELTAAERALVEERLRTDPAAATLVEELRGLSAAVKSLPRESLGRDLRAALLAEATEARADLATHGPASPDQLEPLPPHNHWPGIRRGLVWSAFAIAASLLIGLFQPAERDRDAVTLAKAERDVKSADADRRQEEQSGAAGQKLAKEEGAAIDHIAADDRLPPGLRGGMSAAPPSDRAQAAPADSVDESLDEPAAAAIASTEPVAPIEEPAIALGDLDSAGINAEGPASPVAGAPATMEAGEAKVAAALADAGRGAGPGGLAAPTGDAAIPSPMTVTLRTTGPGGAARFEQLLAESRLALDEPFDKAAEKRAADQAAKVGAAISVNDGSSNAPDARITDGVIVEATPQQVEALLVKCREDQQTFAAVEVQSATPGDRAKFFAERNFAIGGAGGGGAGAPSTLDRDGKRLLWAREQHAAPRLRQLGAGEAVSPTEELTAESMNKRATPADAPAPLAAQPEESATRSSLMTAPKAVPYSAYPAEPPSEETASERAIAAQPSPRIRVLFLFEPAEAPAAPPASEPAKATE